MIQGAMERMHAEPRGRATCAVSAHVKHAPHASVQIPGNGGQRKEAPFAPHPTGGIGGDTPKIFLTFSRRL